MKLLFVLAVWAVVGWVAWRFYCAVEPHLRGFHRFVDKQVDPHLDRAGLGRFVDFKTRLNRNVETAVDKTNTRAKVRGDQREWEATERRRTF